MEIEHIHCENRNDESLWATYKERLLGDLEGKVFHLTSRHAWNLIQASGAVEHNKNELFKINTGSQKSFGRLMGWVCLFDLRHATPDLITDTLDRYDFLLPPGDLGSEMSNGLAYLILDSKYYDRLIPYEKYNEHVRNTGQYPMAVPKVETWILDKVPPTWIKRVVLVSIEAILTDAQMQRNRILKEAHQNLPWCQD